MPVHPLSHNRFVHAASNALTSTDATASDSPVARPATRRPLSSRHPSLEGLSRRDISESLAVTAYDSIHGAYPRIEAFPCSGSLSSSSVPSGFTRQEIEPYRRLEQQHADLFASSSIAEVDDSIDLNMPSARTKDVDLDECVVINTARDGFDFIGTTGLSNCIGLGARGKNRNGETLLGMFHYSGDRDARQALGELRDMMAARGARGMATYLVGGMISKDPDLNSLSRESALLSLRHEFNIQGARLHVSLSTDINDAEFVNMLMTPAQIYFSKDDLYDPS